MRRRVEAIEIDTPDGRVRGVPTGRAVVFRSLPYAEPLGAGGRFRPPAPVRPWDGTRDVSHDGPWAPQNPPGPRSFHTSLPPAQSEDCQWLTVWTPSVLGAAPVMVWFHGGGFVEGSAGLPLYDAARLAVEQSVVIVAVNYRLGVLGYAAHEELRDPESGVLANWGLLDQIAALRWVQRSIASFGGDPGAVTVAGQSAGSMSICALLASGWGDGLLNRVILQSGGPSARRLCDAASALERITRRAGLSGPGALRQAPLDIVLRVQRGLITVPGTNVLRPVVDGDLVPQHPFSWAGAVPVLAGTTSDEVRLFHLGTGTLASLTWDQLRRRIAGVIGETRATEVVGAYRAHWTSDGPADLLVRIESDRTLRAPLARFVAGGIGPRYWFRTAVQASPEMGACHGVELPLLFGNGTSLPFAEGLGAVAENGVGRSLRRAWASFARIGKPWVALADGGSWPEWAEGSHLEVAFGPDGAAISSPGDADLLANWQDDEFEL